MAGAAMTEDIRLSTMLSRWLRDDPQAGGLRLDAQGWADVEAVLAAFARDGAACD
jgi:putative RNA 2'-phosphotransferase